MTEPQGPADDTPGAEPVERFHATSGHVAGGIALAIAVIAAVLGVVDGGSSALPTVLGAIAFGIVAWAVMLRPRVWATHDDLVMRSMLHTVSIPLAAIEEVAVRQVLAVSAGERRFVSPAIGRSRRQMVKGQRLHEFGGQATLPMSEGKTGQTPLESYPVFVEERIGQLAENARAKRGIRRFSEEQAALASGVRRHWAWPEIAGLALIGVAFVVALVV